MGWEWGGGQWGRGGHLTALPVTSILTAVLFWCGVCCSCYVGFQAVVVQTAAYSMTGTGFSIQLALERLLGESQLRLVCDVKEAEPALFSSPACLPAVYLVTGHAFCSALPPTVQATSINIE